MPPTHHPLPFAVALVGYGLSTKIFHLPFLLQLPADFTVHGIVQRRPTSSNDAAADFPSARIYGSFEEMLADEKVELVVLCTPPATHFEMCRKAIEGGKNVLVEKPFVPTAKEGEELVRLAKEKGVVVCVYQNRRFDGDFLMVEKLISEGRLGRVLEFETHFDRYRPQRKVGTWKDGVGEGLATGAMFDLGTHLVDQAVALFGVPKQVVGVKQWCQRGSEKGKTEEDGFTILLKYEDGLLVTAKASAVSAKEKQLRYWVRGDKGGWRKEGLDPQEEQLLGGMKATDDGFARESEDWHGELTESVDGKLRTERMKTDEPKTYRGFYSSLAAALRREGEGPVDAGQSVQVIRLIEMARESSDTGKIMDV